MQRMNLRKNSKRKKEEKAEKLLKNEYEHI